MSHFEIPNNLRKLYNHWEKHTRVKISNSEFNIPDELLYVISERMKIWKKKESGQAPPFTTDPILQKYRFCNIYRELDRQTIDIHSSLLDQRVKFPVWLLNVVFFRFVCRTETVKNAGALDFNQRNNEKIYKKLVNHPKPKYGNAHVFAVSVIQKSEYPTREEFLCFYLPKVVSEVAEKIVQFDNSSVNDALKVILPIFGFNFRFHWAEVLIDVAYQYPDKINLFRDFPVGPGALPTAKLINSQMDPSLLVEKCVGIKLNNFPYLMYKGKPVMLYAENWEGIFCEYRKYMNLKAGKGRIRKYENNKV